jgi:DNA-binding NarL/FixJ family response regulator
MTEWIRILIVDDQPTVRLALSEAVSIVDGVEVVGVAEDGHEAVKLANQLQPDVVLMDIAMPHMGGIEATRRIVAHQPDCRVIGLSMYEDGVGDEICEAGAVTFIPKLCEHAVLTDAIRFAVESPPRKPR